MQIMSKFSSVQCITGLFIMANPLRSCFSDFSFLLKASQSSKSRLYCTSRQVDLCIRLSLRSETKRICSDTSLASLCIDRNSGLFNDQCFNLFVTTFLFNTVENKKEKITRTNPGESWILDSTLWIPDSGYQIPGTGFRFSSSVDSGFPKGLDSKFFAFRFRVRIVLF